jgi:hypothetical protein
MCHSVEMYMPEMTRRAAERRIGEADFAAAERERRVVGAGLGLMAMLLGWLFGRGDKNITQDQVTHD